MGEELGTDIQTRLGAIMQHDESRRKEYYHVDYGILRQKLAEIIAQSAMQPTDEVAVTGAE